MSRLTLRYSRQGLPVWIDPLKVTAIEARECWRYDFGTDGKVKGGAEAMELRLIIEGAEVWVDVPKDVEARVAIFVIIDAQKAADV